MNSFHVLMMKIPFQAQEKAGPARWLVLGFALTPAAKLSQGAGTRSREGDPRSEVCPEHGVRAQGEGLTMDYQHRLLSYHPPGQLVPRIKITLVL